MFQKRSSRRGQRDAANAADHERDADFVFQVPDLPAERGLRGVQPPLGRDRQAAFLSDCDEVAKVAKLHTASHAHQV